MNDKPKVIRVNETPQQRVDRLRAEMHAVGTPSAPTAPRDAEHAATVGNSGVVTHDGPDLPERQQYVTMTLDDVFTAEAKALLALPMLSQNGSAALYPKDRAQILKAIVAFRAMQQKIGPIWGANLDDTEESESA